MQTITIEPMVRCFREKAMIATTLLLSFLALAPAPRVSPAPPKKEATYARYRNGDFVGEWKIWWPTTDGKLVAGTATFGKDGKFISTWHGVIYTGRWWTVGARGENRIYMLVDHVNGLKETWLYWARIEKVGPKLIVGNAVDYGSGTFVLER